MNIENDPKDGCVLVQARLVVSLLRGGLPQKRANGIRFVVPLIKIHTKPRHRTDAFGNDRISLSIARAVVHKQLRAELKRWQIFGYGLLGFRAIGVSLPSWGRWHRHRRK